MVTRSDNSGRQAMFGQQSRYTNRANPLCECEGILGDRVTRVFPVADKSGSYPGPVSHTSRVTGTPVPVTGTACDTGTVCDTPKYPLGTCAQLVSTVATVTAALSSVVLPPRRQPTRKGNGKWDKPRRISSGFCTTSRKSSSYRSLGPTKTPLSTRGRCSPSSAHPDRWQVGSSTVTGNRADAGADRRQHT